MCTMSMVYDHFDQQFPKHNQWPYYAPMPIETPQPLDATEAAKAWLQKISEFNEAKGLAAKLDELTKQKDCVDAEKKKLDERVALLERIIERLLSTTNEAT